MTARLLRTVTPVRPERPCPRADALVARAYALGRRAEALVAEAAALDEEAEALRKEAAAARDDAAAIHEAVVEHPAPPPPPVPVVVERGAELLSVSQVARVLGRSRSAVQRALVARRFPEPDVMGLGGRLWRRRTIETFGSR